MGSTTGAASGTAKGPNPYLELLEASANCERDQSKCVVQTTVPAYTDEDFSRLASGERLIGGFPESSAWGVVFFVWVLFVAVPMLIATGELSTGAKAAQRKFTAFSTAWTPGFLVLTLGWSLRWHVVGTVLIALSVSMTAWGCQWAWKKRNGVTLRRHHRLFLAAAGIWWLVLQGWGFIWRWQDYFTGIQFVALHLSMPVLFVCCLFAWRWVARA